MNGPAPQTAAALPRRPASAARRALAGAWPRAQGVAAMCAVVAVVAVFTAPTAQAQPTAAAPAALRLTDDRGVTLTLAQPPQRIVSLLPSLTETVCALDGCARLVGVDRWSNWPAAVQALPRLSGLEDVQIEALLRLKPDLVLAARSQRALDRIESLGVPVLALTTDTHADLQRTLAVVAAVLGDPARGPAAWAALQQQMAAAAARVPPALRGARAYVEIGATPYAAGPGSFIGQTLQALGLGNVVPPEMGPFPQLNPEFVVRAQPDVVLTVAREARTMAQRPGWGALRALQAQRLCAFDAPAWDVLVRPGPRLGEAAALVADCLAALPPTVASPPPPGQRR